MGENQKQEAEGTSRLWRLSEIDSGYQRHYVEVLWDVGEPNSKAAWYKGCLYTDPAEPEAFRIFYQDYTVEDLSRSDLENLVKHGHIRFRLHQDLLRCLAQVKISDDGFAPYSCTVNSLGDRVRDLVAVEEMYELLKHFGGSQTVFAEKKWSKIARALGFDPSKLYDGKQKYSAAAHEMIKIFRNTSLEKWEQGLPITATVAPESPQCSKPREPSSRIAMRDTQVTREKGEKGSAQGKKRLRIIRSSTTAGNSPLAPPKGSPATPKGTGHKSRKVEGKNSARQPEIATKNDAAHVTIDVSRPFPSTPSSADDPPVAVSSDWGWNQGMASTSTLQAAPAFLAAGFSAAAQLVHTADQNLLTTAPIAETYWNDPRLAVVNPATTTPPNTDSVHLPASGPSAMQTFEVKEQTVKAMEQCRKALEEIMAFVLPTAADDRMSVRDFMEQVLLARAQETALSAIADLSGPLHSQICIKHLSSLHGVLVQQLDHPQQPNSLAYRQELPEGLQAVLLEVVPVIFSTWRQFTNTDFADYAGPFCERTSTTFNLQAVAQTPTPGPGVADMAKPNVSVAPSTAPSSNADPNDWAQVEKLLRDADLDSFVPHFFEHKVQMKRIRKLGVAKFLDFAKRRLGLLAEMDCYMLEEVLRLIPGIPP